MTSREFLTIARSAAWWPFGNCSSPLLYEARKQDHTRLREALEQNIDAGTHQAACDLTEVVLAARLLAEHSGSNRYGVAYYERKAAMQRLRAAIAVLDGIAA